MPQPHRIPALTPLGIAILSLLARESMHPYEMRHVIRVREIDRVMKVTHGTLYSTVERLAGTGLIQPVDSSEESPRGRAPLRSVGCLGRLTHFEENGDDRYFIILEGICRFDLVTELTVMTPYRQAVISAAAYASDFEHGFGADSVDRDRFIKMMHDYADFASLEMNWDEIAKTPTADLVNFCCMVSPYGAAEKQALIEATTIRSRAETLIAMAEVEMARGTGAVLQ